MNPRALCAALTVSAASVLLPTATASAAPPTCTRWATHNLGSFANLWNQITWYSDQARTTSAASPGAADVACWDAGETLSIQDPGTTVKGVQGGALEVGTGTSLTLGAVDSSLTGLTLDGGDLGGGSQLLTVAGPISWQTAGTINGGGGTLAIEQSTGTATIDGTSAETVAGGSLQLDHDATIGGGAFAITGSATVTVKGTLTEHTDLAGSSAGSALVVGTLAYDHLSNGAIGNGPGHVAITGTTTIEPSHDLSFGDLEVRSGGKLYVNDIQAAPSATNPHESGPIAVKAGGILTGRGVLGTGALTVESGGTVAPGVDTIDVLTTSGPATLAPGSHLAIQLGGPATGQYDRFAVAAPAADLSLGDVTIDTTYVGGYDPDARAHFQIASDSQAGVLTTGSPTITPAGRFTTATTGQSFTLTPTKAAPPVTVALVASPNPAVAGHAVTLTATVTNGLDGDLVHLYDGTDELPGSPVSLSGGKAVLHPTFARGTHALSATDAGSTPAGTTSLVVDDVPGAPVVSATASLSTVTVTVAAPADTGGLPVTDYTATLGGQTKHLGAPGPVTFSGLADSTTYVASVTATSAAGTGAPGTASATTPGPTTTPPPAGTPGGPGTPATTPPVLTVPVITGISPRPGTLTIAVSLGAVPGVTVTSLTVTCTGLGGQPAASVTGPTSPLALTGLVNNSSYSCTAFGHTSLGSTLPSAAVKGRPGKLPTVTIKATRKAYAKGARVVLSGLATAAGQPVGRQRITVTFQATGSRKVTMVGSATTSAKGAWSVATRFARPGAYVARMVFGPATAFTKGLVVKRAV